ncbi:hypothetical protein [Tenacibaculum ovolyticum]|nr:hypothetical protein [Tenacibaculum ovolyticum]
MKFPDIITKINSFILQIEGEDNFMLNEGDLFIVKKKESIIEHLQKRRAK